MYIASTLGVVESNLSTSYGKDSCNCAGKNESWTFLCFSMNGEHYLILTICSILKGLLSLYCILIDSWNSVPTTTYVRITLYGTSTIKVQWLIAGRNTNWKAENTSFGYVKSTCWNNTCRRAIWLYCGTWREGTRGTHAGLHCPV